MFCSCNDSDSQSADQYRATPNIQKQQNTSKQNNQSNALQGPLMQTRQSNVHQPNYSGKGWVLNQKSVDLAENRGNMSNGASCLNIQSIEQRIVNNRNAKISLSRKRYQFTSRFNSLQDRVGVLRTAFTDKQFKMQDLSTRINHFIQSQQTISPNSRTIMTHPNYR